jgi:copper chaperone CopZ
MKEATYQLETLTCPSCMAKIDGMLKKTAGIKESEVLFNSSRVKVKFDETRVDSQTIRGNISQLGYSVLSEK